MPIGDPESARHLIADIGGTHARFALCRSVDSIADVSVVDSPAYPTVEAAIRDYLQTLGNPPIRHAVLGIANPIVGDHVKMTNGPWEFSIEATRAALGLESLQVINDFTALALSLPHLPSSELIQHGGTGRLENAPLGLIGPGTGLGVSGLIPTPEGRWVALSGEGGHVGFAPTDETEARLWSLARREYGHASMERLLSGAGIRFIYHSLCQFSGTTPQDYSAAEISRRAMEDRCAVCRQALETFCAILGTAASDLALVLGARGGMYLGGGIIPKLGDWFARSPFRKRFEQKGRFRDYLAAIPVYVITSGNPGLVGAAAHLEAMQGRNV